MQCTPGQPASTVQGFSGTHGPPSVQRLPSPMQMPAPPVLLLNCPPGLEYLSQIDQILIYRQPEPLEIISDFEMPTKYILKNIWGQSVYFAAEENDCCTLNCYPRSLRPFTIKIFNNLGQEVIELRRPCRCWCGCCCGCTCSLQELEVHAPPGTPIGYIKETCHPGRPKFSVQDEAKEEIFKIAGHSLKCMCTEDFRFEVMSKDEQESVGRISKQWAGITGDTRETFTDADLFGIEFPMDFDVKMKAVMIGAGFLINYMYFGEDPIVITETHVI
ncbi:phospholipid scramblase 1-like isoform X3 [Hemicordylus capensis]|uniref:phospholipid scramblase 1-like isoform X3 n=1 Tax=Hemicordylus capensis TaxID=884348 RepID=UPI00230262AC|nr:phospholipid scramblase 1-like isoform X3 [Hemicordylus capensis]